MWITSRHGRVKAQVRLVDGVAPNTVWTWNAIGKRRGAWALSPDAPEATRGFLLNHLIDELLPPGTAGHRYANADPITGQAAWYDLRVRLEPAAEGEGLSEPGWPALPRPPGLPEPPADVRYGKSFRKGEAA